MARKVTREEYHKARKQRSVSISETKWRAKTKKAPGRLTGPKGKLYTGTVDLGEGKGLAVYEKGKRVGWRGKGLTSPKKKKKTATGSSRPASGSGSKPSKSSTGSRVTNTTASRIGGYTPGTKLAGSGKDGVNAATSAGSARTSDYVHDSFSSYWLQPHSNVQGSSRKRATQNRPSRGERSRLVTDKQGRKRWIKVV